MERDKDGDRLPPTRNVAAERAPVRDVSPQRGKRDHFNVRGGARNRGEVRARGVARRGARGGEVRVEGGRALGGRRRPPRQRGPRQEFKQALRTDFLAQRGKK